MAREKVYVGDEAGVQGRFQQNIGQALSSVFGSCGYHFSFSDFKSSGHPYHRVPDSIIMSDEREIHVVGELKAPWVAIHDLAELTKPSNMRLFRGVIGQIARYMKDLNVAYGFLSTYNQTVFLKQQIVNGQWVLFYSSVYQDVPKDTATSLCVRKCFFFLGIKSSQAGPAHNSTPNILWSRRTE